MAAPSTLAVNYLVALPLAVNYLMTLTVVNYLVALHLTVNYLMAFPSLMMADPRRYQPMVLLVACDCPAIRCPVQG